MTQDIHAEKILILDFGSQYTQLIARRVREANVYCEIYAWDVADHYVRDFNPNGIILSGGPESVTVEQGPRAPAAVWELGVPVLGICYGMQTMAAQLGGEVETSTHKEFGYARVRARGHSKLFARYPGPRQRRRPRPARRLDEPRRPGEGTAGRLQAHRQHR